MKNTTTSNSSLANFMGATSHSFDDVLLPDDPEQPQVAIPGVLQLTREQEDAMLNFVDTRVRELELSLGRAEVTGGDWEQSVSLADLDTFMGRRRLFEAVYFKRMEWRRHAIGQIFASHNLHVPVVRRQVQQQISRAINYFFGTEPWLDISAQGDGLEDDYAAKKINRFAQWKFRRARIRQTFEQAIERAFIIGEGIVKVVHKQSMRYYEDILTVAVDPRSGEELLASDGDYIQATDVWIPMMDEATGEPMMDEATGEPIRVLKRDPSTVYPSQLFFEERRVRRSRVTYNGPDAQNVYYLDFLCPEDAPSIEEADLVAHIYTMNGMDLARQYTELAGTPSGNRLKRILDRAASGGSIDGPAADGDRAADGSRNNSQTIDTLGRKGRINVEEVYFRFDADQDGYEEEIMLVRDRDSKTPIFYDFVDRVTYDGKRPFYDVRINPREGRWGGNGQVDTFFDIQMFIDLTMNRWNRAQSEEGNVIFWNPACVYEGDGNPRLKYNDNTSYTLKPGKSMSEALDVKSIYSVKGQELLQQLEFYLQLATTLGGVANANDNAMAGLDTTKLATGVRNIEKSGQEMFGPFLSHLEAGIAAASEHAMQIIVSTMDDAESFEFFDGESQDLVTVTKSEVEQIDWNLEIQLTRYRTEQVLSQSLHALDVIDRFYAEIPEKQRLVLPIYVDLLKLFGIQRADALLQVGFSFPPGGAAVATGSPDQVARSVAVNPAPPFQTS